MGIFFSPFGVGVLSCLLQALFIDLVSAKLAEDRVTANLLPAASANSLWTLLADRAIQIKNLITMRILVFLPIHPKDLALALQLLYEFTFNFLGLVLVD